MTGSNKILVLYLSKQKNALTDENIKFRKMMNELIENNPLFEGLHFLLTFLDK